MKSFFENERALLNDLVLRGWARFKVKRDGFGRVVEDVLIAFSALAVVLVIFNEFLPHEQFTVPVLGITWTAAQQIIRLLTWGSFVTVFLVYGLSSHRPLWNYACKWWLELVICILWSPILPPALIHQFPGVLSLQTLVLIGTVAHVARISGWSRRKLEKHPVWAVGAWTASLITICTVVLMFVEPQTFTNFHESALSVFMTALTIGGDIRPTTLLGKDIFAMVATAGVAILAVWYGVIREWVQYTVFKHLDATKKILEELATVIKHIATVRQLIEEKNELQDKNYELGLVNHRLLVALATSQSTTNERLARLETHLGIEPADVALDEHGAAATPVPEGKLQPDGS